MDTLFLRSSKNDAVNQQITLPPNVKTVANLKAMLSITHFDLMVEPEDISLTLAAQTPQKPLQDSELLANLPTRAVLVYDLPENIDTSAFSASSGASAPAAIGSPARSAFADDDEDDVIDLDTGMAQLSAIAPPTMLKKAEMQMLGLSGLVTDAVHYHSSVKVAKETIEQIIKKYKGTMEDVDVKITDKTTVLQLLESGILLLNTLMVTDDDDCLNSAETLVRSLETICRGLSTNADTVSILAQVLGSHANLLKIRKNFIPSVRQYQACYQLQSAVGDVRGSVLTLLNAVGALMQAGEKQRALTLALQAKDMLEAELNAQGVIVGACLAPRALDEEASAGGVFKAMMQREGTRLPLSALPMAATLSMALRVCALIYIVNKQVHLARDLIEHAVAVAETVLQHYPEKTEDSGISDFSEWTEKGEYEQELALCLLEYAKILMADRKAKQAALIAENATQLFETNKRIFDEHKKPSEKTQVSPGVAIGSVFTPQGFIQAYKPHLAGAAANTATADGKSPQQIYVHSTSLFNSLNLTGTALAMSGDFSGALDAWLRCVQVGEESGASVDGVKANIKVCEAKLRQA